MVYYVIPEISGKKYYSLKEAEAVCDKQYNSHTSYTIEKYTVDEISYVPKSEDIKDQSEEIKQILENLKVYFNDELVNPYYNNMLGANDLNYTFNEYLRRHHNIDPNLLPYNNEYRKLYNITVRRYFLDLLKTYPIENIEVCRLITTYKASNAICLKFTNTDEYVKSGYECISGNETRDIFPRDITIQLRGDNAKHPSIIVTTGVWACGHNVNTKYTEKVDLSDKNIKNYIENIFLFLNYEE